jgi:hypothetical protein
MDFVFVAAARDVRKLDVTNPEQIKHAVDTDTRRTHPKSRELRITQSAECATDG